MKALIAGGSLEGRAVAAELARRGVDLIYSVARNCQPIEGVTIRRGGFGGAAGIRDYAQKNDCQLLIDITHPYAANMSANLVEASGSDLPLWSYCRPPWQPQDGDCWQEYGDWRELMELLAPQGRIFLAIGRQPLAQLAHRPPHQRWWLRLLPPTPGDSGFDQLLGAAREDEGVTILTGRGPFSHQGEEELFRRYAFDAVVCKNSGATYSYAKLEVARRLKLPVFMSRRPLSACGERRFDDCGELVQAVIGHRSRDRDITK